MGSSTFLSNVDFVAQKPYGFAGEILTFVISAIIKQELWIDCQKISYQNVKEKENAQLGDNIQPTEVNIAWVVVSVGVIRWT